MARTNQDNVEIFEWAKELSAQNQHFSVNTLKCHREFTAFLNSNNYFNAKVKTLSCAKEEKIYISKKDADRIQENVKLWIKSYGATDDEKLKLLTERMVKLHPKTGKVFKDFLKESEKSVGAEWRLADYLCYILCKEITDMNDEELDDLANGIDRDLPLNSARLYSDFLIFLRKKGMLSNGWIYTFNSRGEAEAYTANTAYTAEEFLRMAYCIFNEESWIKERLLEKALNSERDANLWLFVSMHFICGWRCSDIIRLPLPTLPCDGSKVRTRIAENSLDTSSVVNELEYRLRYVPLMPQKTAKYDNVPELKLFVPESLRKPFGTILTIAASYHERTNAGKSFLKKDGDRKHVLSFFGKDFLNACGEHGFGSRRANKAYLQGIEIMTDSSCEKPKGYMLAALARSHKGGFGNLPETTDIYLRDAKFSGYRPEFIAREMFERGVFSFIPALMLEMYAKDDYINLPIAMQTKCISEIGIKASGLENLTKAVETALVRARAAIATVMKHPEDIRGGISDILQNIASGNAPGKQDGFLCLMTAAGFGCTDTTRGSCIGCGYEIYTKTILHCLAREYGRLMALKKKEASSDTLRYTKILKEAVMPAITEMFMSIKRMYPDININDLIDVTEMGALLC